MPESKVRKEAKDKLKRKHEEELDEHRHDRDATTRLHAGTRQWVPWVFIPVGLLGVIWMVVYNLAGREIGFMNAIGDWNIVIALGLIIASFSFMTLWK